jgi:5'-nucleotidase
VFFARTALMRLLITNDDGILAPGIAALVAAVQDLGEVYVVAPESPQSAMAHAITVNAPMTARHINVHDRFEGWAVDGRPADCVKLGMLELIDGRPDFVLSGINAGSNAGINALYSGTVAGAAEGAFFRVPSIAFSLKLMEELDFDAAGAIARKVFERFVAAQPEPATCVTVNIPDLANGPPKGVRVCPLATAPFREHYRKQKTGAGEVVYWLSGREPDPSDVPDTDHAALLDGYVTVTPLRFDLTRHDQLDAVQGWNWPDSFL